MSLQIRGALILILLVGVVSSSKGGTSIGANFIGRDNNGVNYPLGSGETAGVVPQNWWNNIDSGGSTFTGTGPMMLDSAGTFTAVQVIYEACDSWNSDGTAADSDHKLMKGTIKGRTGSSGCTATFIITNLPAGTFNVLVYQAEDGANCDASGTNCAEAAVTVGATTFYVEQEGAWSGIYTKATSTTAGTYTDANYAEFDNVSSVSGNITITAAVNPTQPNNGIGVTAIQITQVSGSPYPPNTSTCSIVTDPQSTITVDGNSAVFSVTASGPCKFQWTTNNVNLPGATNSSLTYLAHYPADNGLVFRCLVYNNVKTNTSAAATLTVDANTPPTLTQGFLRVEQWQNIGSTIGSAGMADLKTNLDSNGNPLSPTLSYYVGGASVPQTSPNVDNFGDRIWGWLAPDVSGDYWFYLSSQDSSELYINATPASGSGTNTLPNPQTDSLVCWWYSAAGANAFVEPGSGTGTTPAASPITLTAGKLYGFVILLKNGSGNDFAKLAWQLSTASPKIPAANLTPIDGPHVYTMASGAGQRASFGIQPVNTAVEQGRSGTFTVAVNTTPTPGAFSVQWYSNNVPISGAIGNTYVTGPVAYPGDNGKTISVHANTLVGPLVSTNATLTVYADTNPPVAFAGSITKIDGTVEVGFSFDEPINPATLVAANFSVLGHSSTFKLATNSYNTYQAAVIDPAGLTPGNTYTAQVQNVADPYGNVMPTTTVPFTVGPVKWAETGVPVRTGQVIPVGSTGFDILNGGRKEWDSYDEVTMAYVKKTNDFDVMVQVVMAEPGSQWTRVGLQARNSLETDVGSASTNGIGAGTHSAYAQTHVNPNQSLATEGIWPQSDPIQPGMGPGAGTGANNGHEQNCRLSAGAASTGWGGNLAGSPSYPNVWLRLVRQGTNIHGFSSSDGMNWQDQNTVTLTDQTNIMSVGVSLSEELQNIWGGSPGGGFDVWGPTDTNCTMGCTFNATYDRLMVAQFRNFVDTPSLSLSFVAGHPTLTYVGALQRASVVTGPYADVPGATSPYTIPITPGNGFYRIRATISSH
jgi:hypothetical protein